MDMAGISVPIKLIKNEVSQDTDGNWSDPTETKYDLFAEIMEAGHGFRTYEAQTQLGMIRRFRIRFRFDLHPNGDWKIEFRGNKWTTISIEQDGERMFYWIITANHK
jgi:hypothetical protein